MSFTYGFYNSVNHDRVYDATQLSAIFDGIIYDGVYMNVGNRFMVRPGVGLTVTVDSGRAWFNHTWSLNDSLLPLTLTPADLLLSRIDAVVLETNTNSSVRTNSLKVITGAPGETPEKPSMTRGEYVNQYPLAYITVPAGATQINQAQIENAVGTAACPFVTGPLKAMTIDQIVAQWQGEWDVFVSHFETAEAMAEQLFRDWFQHLRNELDSNQAANLQNQIDSLTETVDPMESELGMESSTTTFYPDGSIQTAYPDKFKITVFNADGSITETMRKTSSQAIIYTKQITFNSDGTITENVIKP